MPDVASIQANGSLVRVPETQCKVDQCTFSGAACPHDGDAFAGGHLKADIMYNLAFVGLISEMHMVKLEAEPAGSIAGNRQRSGKLLHLLVGIRHFEQSLTGGHRVS